MVWLVLLVHVALTLVGVRGDQIRGLNPDKKAFYKPGAEFTCLDGFHTIPYSMINDDYCDCTGDGSDEPGTAACENGHFFCRNLGHKPMEVLSSRVNDGICDCCDGEDEYDSGANCPNTCEEMGRQAREEARKLLQLQQEGFQKRQQYAADGREKIREAETKKKEIESELEQLTGELESLRSAVEEAEEPERQAKEEHKNQWEEAKEARKKAILLQEARTGFDALDTDSNGEVSVEELQARYELDEDGDGEVSRAEALEYLDKEEAVNFEAFYERVWDVVSDRVQFSQPLQPVPTTSSDGEYVAPSGNEGTGPMPTPSESKEEDEEDDDDDYDDDDEDNSNDGDVMPEYDDATKDLIAKADAARSTLKEKEDKKRDLDRELESKRKFLSQQFGEGSEYASLHERCFEMSDREYTYKLCLFQKVTQRGKSGGRETNLGSWGTWSGPSDNPSLS